MNRPRKTQMRLVSSWPAFRSLRLKIYKNVYSKFVSMIRLGGGASIMIHWNDNFVHYFELFLDRFWSVFRYFFRLIQKRFFTKLLFLDIRQFFPIDIEQKKKQEMSESNLKVLSGKLTRSHRTLYFHTFFPARQVAVDTHLAHFQLKISSRSHKVVSIHVSGVPFLLYSNFQISVTGFSNVCQHSIFWRFF